jgi:sulfate transport system permease protein
VKRPRLALRTVVLTYVGVLIGLPLAFIFQQAFIHGFGPFWTALHDPAMDDAIGLTAKVVIVAVPLNVIFGLGASLWIVRHPSTFTRLLDTIIDVPLAISPIIVGLVLELVYAQTGWFGPALAKIGLQVMFSYPGIVMASIFVSLPLVSRRPGADLLHDHDALDHLGHGLRGHADHGARDRRVRRRLDRFGQHRPGHANADPRYW